MPYLITNLTEHKRIVRKFHSLVNAAVFSIDRELIVDNIEEELIIDRNMFWRKFYLNNQAYYIVERIGHYTYIKIDSLVDYRILKNIKINDEIKSITHFKNNWFPFVVYDKDLINKILRLNGNELNWNEKDGFKDLKNVKLYDISWLILNLDQSNIYIKIALDNLDNYYAFVTNTTKFYSASYNKTKTPHINGGGFILEKKDIEDILNDIRSLQED